MGGGQVSHLCSDSEITTIFFCAQNQHKPERKFSINPVTHLLGRWLGKRRTCPVQGPFPVVPTGAARSTHTCPPDQRCALAPRPACGSSPGPLTAAERQSEAGGPSKKQRRSKHQTRDQGEIETGSLRSQCFPYKGRLGVCVLYLHWAQTRTLGPAPGDLWHREAVGMVPVFALGGGEAL